VLAARLHRQRRLFRSWFGAELPGRWLLALYELTARGGVDLLLFAPLLLPALGHWLRRLLRRRLVCAFLAFEDAGRQRVGCLLHPTRWQGRDMRPRVAFRLLPGFACGEPSYYCLAAYEYAAAPWQEHRAFARQTAGLNWYHYSLAAAAFRRQAASATQQENPCSHPLRKPCSP
jgi:hypothetical protein